LLPLDVEAMATEVVLLIKSALAPVVADVKAVQGQIAGWEARWSDVGALRERVAVVEAKSALPVPDPRHAPPDSAVEALRDRTSTISERVAVLETRTPVPGPAGKDGANGADGANGKDGADGLGFGDLAVVQEGERAFTVRASRDGQVKDLGTLTFPVEIYRGVYLDGKSYEPGDRTTWAGSEWHCNEPTQAKPGDGSKAWTLTVKRGRDGRDGKDAPSLPVVSVRAR
jgi:hypothetical protein